VNLRRTKRVETMRAVQEVALDLFECRGFDEVPIEEIAAKARVGVATVYRHFGTKERLVLWDEYDPQLLAALAIRLEGSPPLEALRAVVASGLASVDSKDAGRVLRRGRLIAAHPGLRVASASDLAAMRDTLAKLLVTAGSVGDELEAQVVAGALVATLEAAIWHWVAGGGRSTLRQTLTMAFRRLERLRAKRP
jgi:AcrR family transcriptional regulator